MIPILWNHDAGAAIGQITNEDGRLFIEFLPHAHITRDSLFNIFGGAGIRVLEMRRTGAGDGIEVQKAEILEFSLCPEVHKAA